MNKLCLLAILSSVLCSSCAYMQTNKNIREAQSRYEGCRLNKDELSLVSKGSRWYLAAPLKEFSISYPAVHDSILLTDGNEPTYTVTQDKNSLCYLPISAGTAATLRLENGYAHVHDLANEVQQHSGDSTLITTLPGARQHRIVAHIDSQGSSPTLARLTQESEPSFLRQSLAAADFVVVDIPGTALYNLAIPVMAPVVFFKEFLNLED